MHGEKVLITLIENIAISRYCSLYIYSSFLFMKSALFQELVISLFTLLYTMLLLQGFNFAH